MNATLALMTFSVGAAALAFWTVARFPGLGPQTVTRALVLTIVMFVLQSPLLGLMSPAIDRFGVGPALLVVVLPSLTLLFWATGCLIRSLVSLAAPYRR